MKSANIEPSSPFDLLPNEILLLILSLLRPRELARGEQVCHLWQDIISADNYALWYKHLVHITMEFNKIYDLDDALWWPGTHHLWHFKGCFQTVFFWGLYSKISLFVM